MLRIYGAFIKMVFGIYGFWQSSSFPVTAFQVPIEKRGHARASERENEDRN